MVSWRQGRNIVAEGRSGAELPTSWRLGSRAGHTASGRPDLQGQPSGHLFWLGHSSQHILL